jgi:hypothetical protein
MRRIYLRMVIKAHLLCAHSGAGALTYLEGTGCKRAPADQEIFRTINDSTLDFHIYNSWLTIYLLEMLD